MSFLLHNEETVKQSKGNLEMAALSNSFLLRNLPFRLFRFPVGPKEHFMSSCEFVRIHSWFWTAACPSTLRGWLALQTSVEVAEGDLQARGFLGGRLLRQDDEMSASASCFSPCCVVPYLLLVWVFKKEFWGTCDQ